MYLICIKQMATETILYMDFKFKQKAGPQNWTELRNVPSTLCLIHHIFKQQQVGIGAHCYAKVSTKIVLHCLICINTTTAVTILSPQSCETDKHAGKSTKKTSWIASTLSALCTWKNKKAQKCRFKDLNVKSNPLHNILNNAWPQLKSAFNIVSLVFLPV